MARFSITRPSCNMKKNTYITLVQTDLKTIKPVLNDLFEKAQNSYKETITALDLLLEYDNNPKSGLTKVSTSLLSRRNELLKAIKAIVNGALYKKNSAEDAKKFMEMLVGNLQGKKLTLKEANGDILQAFKAISKNLPNEIISCDVANEVEDIIEICELITQNEKDKSNTSSEKKNETGTATGLLKSLKRKFDKMICRIEGMVNAIDDPTCTKLANAMIETHKRFADK